MHYDVITVGGGLGGAALARGLAERGVRVLVLEREQTFKDRVRGEQMHCWGVAETQALGIHALLRGIGHEIRYFSNHLAGAPPAPPRDLVETTPQQVAALNFYHPQMQTALLQVTEEAGAHVRRGVTVTGVEPGRPASVRVLENGTEQTYQTRLVVGADGRNSRCRGWAGFETNHDPERMVIAGALLDGLRAPEDVLNLFTNTQISQLSFTVSLGGQRFRSYHCYYKQGQRTPMSGTKALNDFIAASVATGAPAEWFEGIELAGPLASFEGADSWVDHPYREGVVLIGDAAASTDPSFGSGLSLTLRDVRVLRDQLLANEDWDAAAHAYAAEHDRYYGALHRILDWMTQFFFEPGPEADQRRWRAFGRFTEDPSRVPDLSGLGPEFPSDETARRRFFGEDD